MRIAEGVKLCSCVRELVRLRDNWREEVKLTRTVMEALKEPDIEEERLQKFLCFTITHAGTGKLDGTVIKSTEVPRTWRNNFGLGSICSIHAAHCMHVQEPVVTFVVSFTSLPELFVQNPTRKFVVLSNEKLLNGFQFALPLGAIRTTSTITNDENCRTSTGEGTSRL